MSGTDEGEVYNDGMDIKNINVAGVAKKAAMFEPKTDGRITPPVLRKLRNNQKKSETNDATSDTMGGENKPSPWNKVGNSTPATSPKPKVSPAFKIPPTIPKKSPKWGQPIGDKAQAVGTTPATAPKTQPIKGSQNIPFRKLENEQNNSVEKDINHNVQIESTIHKAKITNGNKRASVTDMLKNFQSDSTSSDPKVISVKPLYDSNKISTAETFETDREKSTTNNSEKPTSIQEKIAALRSKAGADQVDLRPKPKPHVTRKGASLRQAVVKRDKDNKRFKRVTLNKFDVSAGDAPVKPNKLTDVDLASIKNEYRQVLIKYGKENRLSGIATEEDDDLYNDIGNLRPFSVIEPMTEEEEYDDVGNVLQESVPFQEDEYDDCGIAQAITDGEELYEPLDDIITELDDDHLSGGSISSKNKEKETLDKKKKEEKEEKDRKEQEKREKKRKEKEDKDRLKEQKKKEKDEKDRLLKLKVDGTEKRIGEGVIRDDCTGAKLDLPAKSGNKVVIMRMDRNPKGKWLVTNSDGKWGYVDADNVEVATPTIRQWMNNKEDTESEDTYENGMENTDELYEEL